MVRDDRAFLGEAFDVLGSFLEVAHRNEQRKVGVLVPGLLEHPVQHPLDVLPDGVAPGLDHHAAADGRLFGQVGGVDDLLVPLWVVLGAGGCDGGLGSLAIENSLQVVLAEVRAYELHVTGEMKRGHFARAPPHSAKRKWEPRAA